LLRVQFLNQVLAKQSGRTEQGDAHHGIVNGNAADEMDAAGRGRPALHQNRSSLLGLSRLGGSYLPSQCAQDERSADAETDHGGKRHQIQRTSRHPEVIREQR
jgi:hypothetical protein